MENWQKAANAYAYAVYATWEQHNKKMKELITERNVIVIISLQYPEDIYHRIWSLWCFIYFRCCQLWYWRMSFTRIFYVMLFLFFVYFLLKIFLPENSFVYLSVCMCESVSSIIKKMSVYCIKICYNFIR